MTFKLLWMRGSFVLGTVEFSELPDAIAYAEENLQQMREAFAASAVKIVDEKGEPRYLSALSRT